MQDSGSVTNGVDTSRSDPRPMNPSALAPTNFIAHSHAKSAENAVVASRDRRLEARFRDSVLPGELDYLLLAGTSPEKRFDREGSQLPNILALGFENISLFNRIIARSYIFGFPSPRHLDYTHAADTIRLESTVMAQARNFNSFARANIDQRLALDRLNRFSVNYYVNLLRHVFS